MLYLILECIVRRSYVTSVGNITHDFSYRRGIGTVIVVGNSLGAYHLPVLPESFGTHTKRTGR